MLRFLSRASDNLIYRKDNFLLLRVITAIFPIGIVFLSKMLLNSEDFNNFQSDYALVLFASLLFSFSFGVVSQISGAQNPVLYDIIILASLLVVVVVSLANYFFIDFFISLFPYSKTKSIPTYLWPLNIIVSIIPNYYLGSKSFLKFFLPQIISSFCIIVGIVLYKLTHSSINIFSFLFVYNLIYLIYNLFRVDFYSLNIYHVREIFVMTRMQIFPFYTAMIGIKNYPYYIIQIFGNAVYGEVKFLVTIFNLINFFISSKILVQANNLLSDSSEQISRTIFIKNVKKIFYFNSVLLFALLIAKLFRLFSISDYIILIVFCVFNIGINISNLINQFYFAIKQSKIRVFGDFISVSIIIVSNLLIHYFGVELSLFNAIVFLIITVWVVIFFNMIMNRKMNLYS